MDFDCDVHGLGAVAEKIVAAGGTIANLIFGLSALVLYREAPRFIAALAFLRLALRRRHYPASRMVNNGRSRRPSTI